MVAKMLVPLDGSPLAEAAVPWVAHLAQTGGYVPVLAQVIPWPTMVSDGLMVGYTPPEVYEEIMEAEQEGAAEYLATISERLAAQGVQTQTVIRQGTPTTGLLDLADELGVTAIVMATHGRSGVPRVFLGSIANSIVHSATVPVLLVRAGAATSDRPPGADRLLVPLDGSALAERALEAATALGHEGSSVALVRVVEPLAAPNDGEQATAPAHDLHDEAAAYLKTTAARLEAQGIQTGTEVMRGAPAEQVIAAARAHDADLIVMSTHGRSGPARWFLGSVADEVVRHADRPVLLVSARTRGATRPAAVAETPSGELADSHAG